MEKSTLARSTYRSYEFRGAGGLRYGPEWRGVIAVKITDPWVISQPQYLLPIYRKIFLYVRNKHHLVKYLMTNINNNTRSGDIGIR